MSEACESECVLYLHNGGELTTLFLMSPRTRTAICTDSSWSERAIRRVSSDEDGRE